MINLANVSNGVVADNKVLIGGLEYMLTDDEVIKLNDIIKGFISSRGTTNTKALSKTETKATKTTQQSKSDSEFPALGTPTCTIGRITAYKTLVRYWEVEKFCPDKVKYALKKSLTEAGATWSKQYGAYEFKTVKACNEWLKAQKARLESK